MVLKHILPMSKPGIESIGLLEVGEIGGHEIVNVDCSNFISGHLAYMTNFEVVGKVLEMNEEWWIRLNNISFIFWFWCLSIIEIPPATSTIRSRLRFSAAVPPFSS